MMCLRKGWTDGWMGCKVLHILALECSNFLEKNLKMPLGMVWALKKEEKNWRGPLAIKTKKYFAFNTFFYRKAQTRAKKI